jgi:uncharacterized damage-inducible protein DinB
MTDLRYPIGKFSNPGPLSEEQRQALLNDIAHAPANLRAAVKGLSDQQLDTPYRPGGWTVRQVVHHVPDSHLNSYVRFKLALTEDEPTIKPYAEDRWAELADTKATPIEVSLTLLDSLHDRWVRLLRSLTPDDWKRTFRHPDLGAMTLEKTLALYAWHGRHHVAHVTYLRQRSGWQRRSVLLNAFVIPSEARNLGFLAIGRYPGPSLARDDRTDVMTARAFK